MVRLHAATRGGGGEECGSGLARDWAADEGIETAERDGVTLRVYGVAKTVADCFKHRNRIGLDVALEALKDARAQRRATADDLWRHAKLCRVADVMRPYLEAVG